MNSNTKMCDVQTRVWCCRILLTFSVLGVLFTMIYQIWSYYFSLMKQMDDQTFETPRVGSIIEICDDIKYVWNSHCSRDESSWLCTLETSDEFSMYLDQYGSANTTQTGNNITIQSIESCVRIIVWFIPW